MIGFPHASGMHPGIVWVSIFCLASVVSVAEGENMQLQLLPQFTGRCGENVTLTCNFSSSNLMNLHLITFSLLAENETKVCKYKEDKADREFHCVSKNMTSHLTLTMTLINIMPVSEGKYICKVHTNRGVPPSNRTFVKVQDCSGSSSSFRNASHATCSFSGVYPSGVVHWFQGDSNLTEDTVTKEEKDQSGLYTISSTITGGSLTYPYNCSLWIPSLHKYLSSQEVKLLVTQGVKTSENQGVTTSGTTIKLQWICIVVEILMLSFRV